MGLFFPSDPDRFPEIRKTGFPRYAQVLERDWKRFFCVNLLTLLFMLPLALGIAASVLLSSVLILLPAAVVGGAIAGLGIAGMYDVILRALRDDINDWWFSYKKAMKQNWRSALLPGMAFGLFTGFFIFACYMLWVSGQGVSLGTAVVMLGAAMVALVVFSLWWPQIVLFAQSPKVQLRNCLLFTIQNFWRVLGAAALQLAWWAVFVLFLPWTAFLVPVLGVWYLWFVSTHLIYPQLDKSFRIEEQIQEAFPAQFGRED